MGGAQKRAGRHDAAGRARSGPPTKSAEQLVALDQVRRVRHRPGQSRSRPRHAPAAQSRRVSQHDPRPDGRRLRHRRKTSRPTIPATASTTSATSLSLSPLLMEKYIQAAETIVAKARAEVSKVVPDRRVGGGEFKSDDGKQRAAKAVVLRAGQGRRQDQDRHAGRVSPRGRSADRRLLGVRSGPLRGDLRFRRQAAVSRNEYEWRDSLDIRHEVDRALRRGRVSDQLRAQAARAGGRETALSRSSASTPIRIEGPLDEKALGAAAELHALLSRWPAARRAAPSATPTPARCCSQFATRAFRRPVDEASVDGLSALAKIVYEQPGKTFEEGIGQAMVAVLSSPRFLFRVEEAGRRRRARPIRWWTNTRSRRGSPISSGRRCRTTELIDLAESRRAASQSRRPGRADARRPALGGVRERLHRPVAAGPRRRDDLDRCRGGLGYQKEWEAMLDEFRAAATSATGAAATAARTRARDSELTEAEKRRPRSRRKAPRRAPPSSRREAEKQRDERARQGPRGISQVRSARARSSATTSAARCAAKRK